MGMAITESLHRGLRGKHLSDAYLRGMLQVLIKTLFIDRGNPEQQQQFQEAFGKRAPSFLLIAPGKACNLRCPGCYSDSDDKRNKLEWSLVDRIMEEAKSLWGERFFVISGGEPFAYRSEGKGLMELFEKHQDCFFMVYTNGTLIDDRGQQAALQEPATRCCAFRSKGSRNAPTHVGAPGYSTGSSRRWTG